MEVQKGVKAEGVVKGEIFISLGREETLGTMLLFLLGGRSRKVALKGTGGIMLLRETKTVSSCIKWIVFEKH